jgi:glutathione S-transferase
MLYAAHESIALEMQLVDLFNGEDKEPAYLAINPNDQVPTLENGDFRITESSAILKYLADKKGARAYPTDAKQRAHVNEMMDWFNTELPRGLCYNLVYAQTLPDFTYPDAAVQSATLARAQKKANHSLSIMDKNFIMTRNNFVCGDKNTLADYLGVCFLAFGGSNASQVWFLFKRIALAQHNEGTPELGNGKRRLLPILRRRP